MTTSLIEAADELADLTEMIERCAGQVTRKFARWAEKDDLIQEGWLWALENRARVDEWLETEQPGLVAFWLKRAMIGYARKEKADRSGYSRDDEFFYSLPALRRLLPIILVSDGSQANMVAESHGTGTTNKGDTYGEFEAVWVDVRAAFRELQDVDKHLLWAYYVEEVPGSALAAIEGVTEAVISGRVRAALKRLQKNLGGPKP